MSVPRGEVGDPAEIEHLALGPTLFRTSYQLKIAGHPDPVRTALLSRQWGQCAAYIAPANSGRDIVVFAPAGLWHGLVKGAAICRLTRHGKDSGKWARPWRSARRST